MIKDCLVEITSVFPSPLGGAIFRGIRFGEKKVISFKANYKVIKRVPKLGEYWKISGDEIHTNDYGIVVNVQSASLTTIPSAAYVERLLKRHSAFRGISFGKSKISKLISTLGPFKLVEVLNANDHLSLTNIGLNSEIAQRVCEAWSELKNETDLASFFSEHNIDSSFAAKIIRICRINTLERLKQNPFSLIALSTARLATLRLIADIAFKLGISKSDEKTSIALVEFAIYEHLESGHTIVALPTLVSRLLALRKIISCATAPEDMIRQALAARCICTIRKQNQIYVQAIGVAFIEQTVEKVIYKLLNNPVFSGLSHQEIESVINKYKDEYLQRFGFRLTQAQIDSISMSLQHRISLISGFGGTGKTTILKSIVELAERQGTQVYVSALAGKAAARAKQAIERDTYTIHALIIKFRQNRHLIEAEPLIIIDEASMVDISLINALFKVFDGKLFRLLLVGDVAQLPPIGFGLFFHVLINSNVPKKCLTEVHRVKITNPIHQAAMSIRAGDFYSLPSYTGQQKGIFIIDPIDSSRVVNSICDLRTKVDALTLTSYSNERYVGSTTKINYFLQEMLNQTDKLAMRLGSKLIKVGDPVIATTNVYSLNIFNGMTGKVLSINFNDSEEIECNIQFDFNDVPSLLTQSQCWEIGLDLAYALTIHKAQGSEYDNCIICLTDRMERSALYTAVTRTKNLCIIIGSQDQFHQTIKRPALYTNINCGLNFFSFTGTL
jgi:exodeoxyribonuclease V alpha subunit